MSKHRSKPSWNARTTIAAPARELRSWKRAAKARRLSFSRLVQASIASLTARESAAKEGIRHE